MSARPLLLALPLLAFGCAEAAPAKVNAPPQGSAAAVTEVDLSPSASPTATPAPSSSADAEAVRLAARQKALQDAKDFGMLGMLGMDPDAPTAPVGPQDTLATMNQNGLGALTGDTIGDSFGVGGLGLIGTGPGAGGTGQGIGLGSIGTLGHGSGTGTGSGYGMGSGRLSGTTRTNAPKVRIGASSVSGRLPPEVIQRIVRQSYGRFRFCYEKGLQKTPTLTGKVTVRFVIGTDGAITSATNAGSDLPSKDVVDCVVKAFRSLSFPQPEGGIVTAVYPILFEPGDPPAPPAAAPKTPPPAPAPKAPPASAAPKVAPVDLDDGP